MSGKKIFCSACFMAALLLLLLGCEGDRGPTGSDGTIPVSLHGQALIYGPCHVDMTVANLPSIPSLQINGLAYPLLYDEWLPGFDFSGNDMPLHAGDSIHISVDFLNADGSPASAVVHAMIPDSFNVTSPDPDTLSYLPWGESVTFTWSHSAGADVYEVYFHSHTAWGWPEMPEYFNYSVDTFLVDTTISFPAELIFPDPALVDSVLSSSGNFTVYAQSGPWQTNDPGNVTGDGEGFFICRTRGSYLYFTFEE